MTRAMPPSFALFFVAATLGCNPRLTREEGALLVVARVLPTTTRSVDLVLERGGATQRQSFPAVGSTLEMRVEGLAVGALQVFAEARGANAELLATRRGEATITSMGLAELGLDFGDADDAGVSDASGPEVSSARFLVSFRLREDAVSASQLTESQTGNGPALVAFLSQATAELGAAPLHLRAASADLRLVSGTSISHLGELYSEVSLLLLGLDTSTEVELGHATVIGTPTSLALSPSAMDVIGLANELQNGRFALVLRGPTPRRINEDFEAFVEAGFTLAASL